MVVSCRTHTTVALGFAVGLAVQFAFELIELNRTDCRTRCQLSDGLLVELAVELHVEFPFDPSTMPLRPAQTPLK